MEFADIVRYAGQRFVERSRRWINGQHEKVLAAIARCRPAALGGHRDQCSGCGHTAISYNSCHNRHCRSARATRAFAGCSSVSTSLLPTHYVHAVFTMPRELAPLALQNKQVIYRLLFRASAATLLEVARDPRHLGAEIGFFSVLHTWNQRLQHHPHVHCVIAAGGLAPDHAGWISSRRTFFLPVKVLGRVFRGKFIAGLKTVPRREARVPRPSRTACRATPLRRMAPGPVPSRLGCLLQASLRRTVTPPALSRCVYSPRASPTAGWSPFTEGQVSFRWRDSAHGNRKRVMSLLADEFLRGFLLHLLPPGFVRIRNFGFLANRQRAKLLPLCFSLLASSADRTSAEDTADEAKPTAIVPSCPFCGGTMRVVERFSSAQLLPRSPPQQARCAV